MSFFKKVMVFLCVVLFSLSFVGFNGHALTVNKSSQIYYCTLNNNYDNGYCKIRVGGVVQVSLVDTCPIIRYAPVNCGNHLILPQVRVATNRSGYIKLGRTSDTVTYAYSGMYDIYLQGFRAGDDCAGKYACVYAVKLTFG